LQINPQIPKTNPNNAGARRQLDPDGTGVSASCPLAFSRFWSSALFSIEQPTWPLVCLGEILSIWGMISPPKNRRL